MSTFTGFSDEDLKRIKSSEEGSKHDATKTGPMLKPVNLSKKKTNTQQYKTIALIKQLPDDHIDDIQFEKCKLSNKTTTPTEILNNDIIVNKTDNIIPETDSKLNKNADYLTNNAQNVDNLTNNSQNVDNLTNTAQNVDNLANNAETVDNKSPEEINGNIIENISVDMKPDIVRGVDLTEDELASHRAKLEELQLKQKLMEEQNKKRKEMLAKALADRTRQTEEEVMKLEKIKKELQVLDGQFSLDVAVLRKKIDQACLSYSDAEKNYLKVEKEFLQAKILLQKEKEKKELLTEHLCALITHNETRKAQKLETLMLELATNKTIDDPNVKVTSEAVNVNDDSDEEPVIIDGVDQSTASRKL